MGYLGCILTISLLTLKVTITDSRSIPDIDTTEGLTHFLQRYGYAAGFGERSVLTDKETKEGIRKYQTFFGLTVTGELDSATTELMKKERCDVPDFSTNRTGRYVLYSQKWNKNLRWRVQTWDPPVSESEGNRLMAEAVAEWQYFMALITIVKSSDADAELLVSYVMPDASGEHGDGNPFEKGVLAHAYFPSPVPYGGDIHHNMAMPFTTRDPPQQGVFSLKKVSVHELGHALGLEHSAVSDGVMYPYVNAGTSYTGLHPDDIQGIQALYGHCLNSPCKNGGTCSSVATSERYRCNCPSAYAGKDCELPNVCGGYPCKNGATCFAKGSGYGCTCPDSHTGTHCETKLNCASSPCQNGGTCQPSGYDYACTCRPLYYGKDCEIVHACMSSPCKNGGLCFPSDTPIPTSPPPSTSSTPIITSSSLPTTSGVTYSRNGRVAPTSGVPSTAAPMYQPGVYFMCICPFQYTGFHCDMARTTLVSGANTLQNRALWITGLCYIVFTVLTTH